jgi:hypothetical protein
LTLDSTPDFRVGNRQVATDARSRRSVDPTADTQIVCDMTAAADTAAERLAEYRRLFAQSLIGRETTERGIRFRFRTAPGLEMWVRDLAAREKACCAFYDFTVTTVDDQVWWDATVVDDDVARALLAEFYVLPDTLGQGDEALLDRFTGLGLRVLGDPATAGPPRPGTRWPGSDLAGRSS